MAAGEPLGVLLRDSGLTEDGLAEALRKTGSGELVAVLARLFVLGGSVDSGEARRAFDPLDLADLERDGFLAESGGRIRAGVRIAPFEGLFIAHDPEEGEVVRSDHVLGVGAATRTLASLTVRRPIESALDLGTGSGAQALLASRHAQRVVATDINPRALRYARTNLALNDIHNVDLRKGSLFGAVEGESFDLIVSNPPFVVSPDTAFVYRDAGQSGDTVSETVVQGAAAHLREGGFATIVVSWVHTTDEDWSARPLAWVAKSGCDAWLLRHRTDDPATYAARWNLGLRRNVDEFAGTIERWRSYYVSEGISAITTGAIVLRRRDGETWVRTDEMPLPPGPRASNQIVRVFDAQDALEAGLDTADVPLELVDGHKLDQRLEYTGGEYRVAGASIMLDNGIGVAAPVAPHAVHVLFRLDGCADLRTLVRQVVETTGLDRAAVEADAAATLRRLFELGLAVVAEH